MYIHMKLDSDFVDTFNELKDTYGERLSELNGFSDEQMNYTKFIDNFVDEEVVADASIDGNSNVSHKDIVTLENEMSKPHSKLLGFNKIFYEIKKTYGKEVAIDWLWHEWVGYLYMHDAYNTTFKPYCFAYDIERLVNEGLYFIEGFNNQPPKHLNTYTDFVGEFISYACNRTSGAVGIPSFLIYSYYFWKKDVESGYTNQPETLKKQEFQRIIYKLNQPYLRGGVQSAFTNFNIYDRPYLEALFGGKEFPDGTFIIDHIDEILEYQKDFMKIVSEIRAENMMTFPVLTISLLRQDGKFVDEDFARWASKHNMKWADSNFFVSDDVTSLSNCCRLLSELDGSYFNSIGGTALQVGSVKVNTVNLARISYESDFKEDYLDRLRETTTICLKSLDRVRHIIKRNIEKGLLPNYTHGLMSMENQYNTIGIIGIYETLDKFGMTYQDDFGNTFYTDEGVEFAKEILKTITKVKDEFGEDKDYSINIEQVPAERAGAVLMEKDRVFFPDEKYELPLYGNQWIPLGVKTTIHEKVRLSAILDKACSGGSIAHINIDAPFTDEEVAWNILNYIADEGVVYFAFCTKIGSCENNHGFYDNVCPYCGGEKIDSYQRIVGFLTPVSSYSKERKEEFALRDWMELNGMREFG